MITLKDFKNLGQLDRIFFMDLLKLRWDEIHTDGDGVFRYKITSLKERKLDKQFLLQLNEDRGAKRRSPEEIDSLHHPFDPEKFNFTKISSKEVLFKLLSADESDTHLFLVNVSPISRYHTLLCPAVNKCLPQIVTRDSLTLAIQIIFTEDRAVRIGFNSLCAFASVNHLHYHIIVQNNKLPIENAECKQIKGPLYCLTANYPIPGFCFEVSTQHSIEQTSKDIYRVLEYLLNKSIAYNIFMTKGEKLVPGDDKGEVVRIVVWARRSTVGAKDFNAFNVAAFELSGWIVVYNSQDFENLKTEDIENELRKWKLDNFDELCEEIKTLF